MKIAIGQINTTVGDLKGNAKKIRECIRKIEEKADLIVFPELTITGYPPQDLLFERRFVKKNKEVMRSIVEEEFDIAGIVGFVDFEGEELYNSAAIFSDGEVKGVVKKTLLPTYDVFDEDRYFEPAAPEEIEPVSLDFGKESLNIGVEICEDLWDGGYDTKVTDILADRGADLLVNISASPFHAGKIFERKRLLEQKSKKNGLPIFYVNLVGGQDELVFDGFSMAVDGHGDLVSIGKQFEEDLVIVDCVKDIEKCQGVNFPSYDRREEIYDALVLGIRDYFRKTGFEKAVLGLSGGIDSSLSACVVTEALGEDNVIGVSMPSKFSSEHSKSDAERLAENLGIQFLKFGIQDIVDTYKDTLNQPLSSIRGRFGVEEDDDDPVADENLQPRARGNCLMDISNRLKELRILVVNTGNKTELALGYCTLYGDMSGGIGVLGDLNKLQVYELSEYVNEREGEELIPENVIQKEPSAELKPDQTDPFDFDIVSPLVDDIIEERKSKTELVESGYPKDLVDDIYRRIKNAEFKRRQMPPCIRVTSRAFGIGWKMPIVNGYSG